MKTTYIALAALFITSLGVAQKQSKADTTTFRIANNTIVLINTASDSTDYDYDFTNSDSLCLKGKKHSEWPKMIVDIGTNGYLKSEGVIDLPNNERLWELNYGRSRALSVAMQFKGYESNNKRFYITPGLGLTWNGYHFENNVAIATNSDETTLFSDTLINNKKYKLRATYIEVPLLIGAKLGKGENPLSVQVGVIGGLRIGSIVKQKYELDGVNHTVKIKDDFNLNPFKVDCVARVTIGDIGFFAKYSLTTLFENGKGPELYPFAVGITVGDF